MKTLHYVLPALCAAALFAGCSKKGDSSADAGVEAGLDNPEVVFDESPMFELFEKVDSILTAGDTNEATRVFAEALTDARFEPFRDQMFNTFIRYLLFTAQVEEAKSRYLAALRTAPDGDTPRHDLIYGYLMDCGDTEGALDWARTLTAQDLPLSVRAAATEWVASGCLAAGNKEGAIEALGAAIRDFPPNVASPIATRFAQSALAAKDVALVESIVENLAARTDEPEFAKVANGLRLRLFAAKGDFEAAIASFAELSALLPDTQFSQGLSELFRAAAAAGNAEAVEKMAEAIVLDDRFAELPITRFSAARKWIDSVVEGDADRVALYPVRFNVLMQKQFAPNRLISIFIHNFYKIIDNEAVLREMDSIGKLLREQATAKGEEESLKAYALDAAFLLENYDDALAIIDAGLSDHDDSWHSMTRAKILAHKALAAGDAPEAVKNFRKFMELLPDETQHDPTSDIAFSRETIIANNEKRIGDIWKNAGEAGKAAEAYAAALEAYKSALEKNTDTEVTASYLEEQIRALEEIMAPAAPEAAPAAEPEAAPAPAAASEAAPAAEPEAAPAPAAAPEAELPAAVSEAAPAAPDSVEVAQ